MLGHSHAIPGMVMRKSVAASPAKIIFHRMYPIRISGIHLVNDSIQEYYGSITTGNVVDDVAMMSAPRTIQIPIAGMAVFLAEGAVFSLENPSHAEEIFDVIQQHLIAWIRSVDNSFNKRSAPLEGLRELEALAEYLYPHVMRQRNATTTETHLYRSLRDVINRRNSFSLTKPTKEKKVDLILEPYHSIAEDLAKELDKREKPWS